MAEKNVEKKFRTFWHFVSHHRRRFLNRTTEEILASQIISIVGAIAAGLVLDTYKNSFALTAGMFILLPGAFDLTGAVAGAYGAKIHHRFCPTKNCPSGTLSHTFGHTLFSSLATAIVASFVLGIITGALAALLFDGSFVVVLAVAVLSCLIVSVIGLPLIGLLTLAMARLNLDPDNFVGPIVFPLFDILTIFAIVFSLGVIL